MIENQSASTNKGITIPNRGVMVDIGRKYFSKAWLLDLVDYMATLNLNTLQLHIADDQGFRIECESFPEITSQEHLTKNEVKEIIQHGLDKGISVFPELDSPGHFGHFLSFYPELRLPHIEDGKLGFSNSALDILNPVVMQNVKILLNEYIELFKPAKRIHLGADEFIPFENIDQYPTLVEASKKTYGEKASGLEVYVDYINELIDFVNMQGLKSQVWNDGYYRSDYKTVNQLDKRTQIAYWTQWNKGMAPVATYLDKGYELINFDDNYFYFVLGENANYTYPTAEKISKEWNVQDFSNHQKVSAKQLKQVKGTMFAIWCDLSDRLTEEEVFAGIKAPLKAMADKLNS